MPAPPVASGPPGFFTSGDPLTGTPATVPGQEWFNGMQEELAGLVEHLGVSPSAVDLSQVRKAVSRWFGGAIRTVTADTVLTADDAGTVLASAAGGNRAVTLPAAAGANGRPLRFAFARSDASANTLTVQRAGTDTVEGATSITIPVGGRVQLISDGVAAWIMVVATAGRLLNVRTFTATGVYAPTLGTNSVYVEVVGGGGGGGAAAPTGAGQISAGSGGGAGGFACGRFASGFSGLTVIVGAGGGNSANGGTSSFGSLLSATGGAGGAVGAAQATNVIAYVGQAPGGAGTGGGTSNGGFNGAGGAGKPAFYGSYPTSGEGGAGPFGSGAPFVSGTSAGNSGVSPGSGGSGAAITGSSGSPGLGGFGAAGLVRIWEYA
jgi:hypothetical protein